MALNTAAMWKTLLNRTDNADNGSLRFEPIDGLDDEGRVIVGGDGELRAIDRSREMLPEPNTLALVYRMSNREVAICSVGSSESDLPSWLEDLDVLKYQRFNPAQSRYGGTLGTEMDAATRTANTDAWRRAADDARMVGGTFVARGEWELDGTVQFRCHVDAPAARVHVADVDIGPVLVCGGWMDNAGADTGWVLNREMSLPEVIQREAEDATDAAANGGRVKGTGVWSGNDIGVAIVKLLDSRVTVPYVDNFTYSLVVAGYGTALNVNWGGTAYNTITVGKMYNGKFAIDVNAGHPLVGNAYGWANHNTFIGAHPRTEDGAGNEGVAVAGARYVRLARGSSSFPVTGNHFITLALENDFPQYHIELEHAESNMFTADRYEPSNPGTTTIKVYFSNATDNLFVGGFGADQIEDIAAGGTTNVGNLLITSRKIRPLAVTEPVSIDFVNGVITFDESVSLYSAQADVLKTDDSFHIPAYPNYIRMGNGYMWDSGTELRKKYGSAPSSATDGTAV